LQENPIDTELVFKRTLKTLGYCDVLLEIQATKDKGTFNNVGPHFAEQDSLQ